MSGMSRQDLPGDGLAKAKGLNTWKDRPLDPFALTVDPPFSLAVGVLSLLRKETNRKELTNG